MVNGKNINNSCIRDFRVRKKIPHNDVYDSVGKKKKKKFEPELAY